MYQVRYLSLGRLNPSITWTTRMVGYIVSKEVKDLQITFNSLDRQPHRRCILGTGRVLW